MATNGDLFGSVARKESPARRGRQAVVSQNGGSPNYETLCERGYTAATLEAGGKFDSNAYRTSGGLHGVGISVVTALSERLEVEVARGQTLYRQIFERGRPKTPLEKLSKVQNRRGTSVRFKPDERIFGK